MKSNDMKFNVKVTKCSILKDKMDDNDKNLNEQSPLSMVQKDKEETQTEDSL